jgi:Fe-S-cluster containining protein
MNRHDRRATASHDKHASRERANTKLRSLLTDIYQRHDEMLENFIDAQDDLRQRIPCKKGCAACCDQFILTTLPEGYEILARYPSVVQDVMPEILAQEQLLAQMGLNKDVLNIMDPSTADARTKFTARYHTLRRPCAFLDHKTKTCRVYEARPQACRSHYIFDADPADCDKRGAEADGLTAKHIWHSPSVMTATAAIAKISDAMEGAYVLGALPIMVRAARQRVKQYLGIDP